MAEAPPPSGLRPAAAPEQHAELFAVLRRRWRTLLICALAGTALAWLYMAVTPTVHRAQTTLLLIAAGDEQSPGGGRARTLDVETWAVVARSTELLQEVADDLDKPLDEVRADTTATAAPTGDVLMLTYESTDADVAVEGATVYGQRFLENRRRSFDNLTDARVQRLENTAESLSTQIEDLSNRIAEEEAKGDEASTSTIAVLRSTQDFAIGELAKVRSELAGIDSEVEVGRVLVDPRSSVSETGLSSMIVLVSGVLVGSLGGFLLALVRDRYDDHYSAAHPAALGIQEIARVPQVTDRNRDDDHVHNAYERLIARLTFARRGAQAPGHVLLLLPVESKTLPRRIGLSVSQALERAGRATGGGVAIWVPTERPSNDDRKLQQLARANELVLVPAMALDRSARGIGLAASADEVLLLVSEHTPTTQIVRAIDDLSDVYAGPPHVLAVTHIATSDLTS